MCHIDRSTRLVTWNQTTGQIVLNLTSKNEIKRLAKGRAFKFARSCVCAYEPTCCCWLKGCCNKGHRCRTLQRDRRRRWPPPRRHHPLPDRHLKHHQDRYRPKSWQKTSLAPNTIFSKLWIHENRFVKTNNQGLCRSMLFVKVSWDPHA